MGNSTLVYRAKYEKAYKEASTHLARINAAFSELQTRYAMPLEKSDFEKILNSKIDLAYADQVIYRFSKAQDTIGAKLFKAYMLYQGSNVDKPFLDLLHTLEKLNIVEVDEWFELREIRNEIAHDYDDTDGLSIDILNSIYKHKNEIQKILDALASKE